jgi:hypothetical protein
MKFSLLLFISITSFAQTPNFIKSSNFDRCKEEEKAIVTKSFEAMKKNYEEDLIPPVRDQDSIGWCYAMSSADLLSFHMAKNKIAPYQKGDFSKNNASSIVSGIGIAHQYNSKVRDKEFDSEVLSENEKNFVGIAEGGDVAEALEHSLKSGICFEDQLSSEDTLIPELHTKRKQILAGKTYSRSDNLRQLYNQVYTGQCSEDALKILFPDFSSDNLKVISHLKGREAMKELSKIACPEKTKIEPKPKIKTKMAKNFGFDPQKQTTTFDDNKEIISMVDTALDSGKIVAVDWDAQSMFNPAYEKELHYPHNSIVVGKTLDKNCKPAYVVKNSYGNNEVSPCEKLVTNKNLSCEGGYIVIPVDELKKTMSGVTYLE